jgi:hypothetical protein
VLVDGVALGLEGVVEEGADAGLDDEESLVDGEAAGLSEAFFEPLSEAVLESDFESEPESPELETESLEPESDEVDSSSWARSR